MSNQTSQISKPQTTPQVVLQGTPERTQLPSPAIAKVLGCEGKGTGKCKGKSKGKGKGAAEHSIQAKSWDQMSSVDIWYLESLWSNDLENAYRDAKARHEGIVQVRYFTVETRANRSQ